MTTVGKKNIHFDSLGSNFARNGFISGPFTRLYYDLLQPIQPSVFNIVMQREVPFGIGAPVADMGLNNFHTF